jgi:hypothetical protein
MTLVAENNPGLKVVNLVLSGVTDSGVLSLGRHCPLLETLNINALPLADTTIIALLQGCRKITSLKMKHNENINDAVFEAIALYQPDFKSVFCGRISAEVQTDNLFMAHVTTASICAMITGCPQLTVVDLSDCNDIDSAMRLLGERCGYQLKSLAFSKSGNVTVDSFLTLSTQCSELTFLEVQGCVCVTDTTLCSLVERNVNLKILMVS